jgi:hypothetical protein
MRSFAVAMIGPQRRILGEHSLDWSLSLAPANAKDDHLSAAVGMAKTNAWPVATRRNRDCFQN